MRKKIIRNLALLNCLLLTFPGLTLAAESNSGLRMLSPWKR